GGPPRFLGYDGGGMLPPGGIGINTMLEDAELTVDCRRYLPGDPPPWAGANLRPGTLVVDIIDKSGVNIGTSHGGVVLRRRGPAGVSPTRFRRTDR
ncbi:unnamed protein product, partial [marine sediment metagenome]